MHVRLYACMCEMCVPCVLLSVSVRAGLHTGERSIAPGEYYCTQVFCKTLPCKSAVIIIDAPSTAN